MSEQTATPPSPAAVLTTLGLLTAGIVALLAVDTFLARLDQAARRSEAAQLFEQGRRLADGGRHREAIDRFRTALAIDRDNRDYRLHLAREQLAAGAAGAAESTLTRLLREQGTDGEANLALARVLVRRGRLGEATAYYHRAIYGLWPRNPDSARTRARLELIDLLAERDARQELLAELLPLEGVGLVDTAVRRRVAHLFVRAGAASRGAAIFRDLLRRNGRDADSYAGLGEVEFARGNYRAAAADFRAALRLDPENAAVAVQLDLTNQVRSLDPMQRGLGSAERERRSAELLRIAVEASRRCLGERPADSVRAALDSAAVTLDLEAEPMRRDEVLEANLALAERFWLLRAECALPPTVPERALELVLEKMNQ